MIKQLMTVAVLLIAGFGVQAQNRASVAVNVPAVPVDPVAASRCIERCEQKQTECAIQEKPDSVCTEQRQRCVEACNKP